MPDEMQITLEVIVVPVSDVDRSKRFYEDQLGFHVDHDTIVSEEMRIVQLTPPGSGCSIVVSKGLPQMEPGTLSGVQLVVSDIDAARTRFIERGVERVKADVLLDDRSLRIDDGERTLRLTPKRRALGGAEELKAKLRVKATDAAGNRTVERRAISVG